MDIEDETHPSSLSVTETQGLVKEVLANPSVLDSSEQQIPVGVDGDPSADQFVQTSEREVNTEAEGANVVPSVVGDRVDETVTVGMNTGDDNESSGNDEVLMDIGIEKDPKDVGTKEDISDNKSGESGGDGGNADDSVDLNENLECSEHRELESDSSNVRVDPETLDPKLVGVHYSPGWSSQC